MKNLSSNIGVVLWYLCIFTIISTGLIPRMMNVTDKCHSENVCGPGAVLSPGPLSSQLNLHKKNKTTMPSHNSPVFRSLRARHGNSQESPLPRWPAAEQGLRLFPLSSLRLRSELSPLHPPSLIPHHPPWVIHSDTPTQPPPLPQRENKSDINFHSQLLSRN